MSLLQTVSWGREGKDRLPDSHRLCSRKDLTVEICGDNRKGKTCLFAKNITPSEWFHLSVARSLFPAATSFLLTLLVRAGTCFLTPLPHTASPTRFRPVPLSLVSLFSAQNSPCKPWSKLRGYTVTHQLKTALPQTASLKTPAAPYFFS